MDRLAEPVRRELQGEPAVDVAEYRVLAQADAQRVLETAGQRVLRGGNRPENFPAAGESFRPPGGDS
jgi:hypothetical protein